ncbi:MAG: hypothetical protein ACI4TX_02745 [Christensenellales bacterium]
MNKRFIRFLSLIFCLCLPFCFYGCSFEVDEDGGDIPSAETMISGVTAIKLGDGETTYAEVVNMVDTLTNSIINGLYDEYGATSLVANFRDSEQDTHKNAMWQDKWRFAGKESYGSILGNSSLWNDEGLDKADYSLVLKYNIYQILLNKPIEDLEVVNLNTNSRYFQMKQAGYFEDEYFISLAKQVSHTGLFYYEADSISEYVLNYMIGSYALGCDAKKFIDINDNGTFDYEENVCSLSGVPTVEYRLSTIKNYNMNKQRAEGTARNVLWDKITFGNAVGELVLPSDELKNEMAYSISYLRQNNIANTYTLDGVTYYSGFKNYVNTVYYIVYTAVGNVFTMTHLPNATFEDIETEKVSVTFDEDDSKEMFNITADTYCGVIIKASQTVSLSSIWLYIELDSSVTETVEFSIDATYNHCEDTTNHTHSGDCVFNKMTSNLGSLKIKPGKCDEETESLYADLTITDEVIKDLKDKGVNTDGLVVTEFTKNGIYSFDLTKYEERTNEEGEIEKVLIASESPALVGCDFEIENDFNDYVEIKFNIKSTHSSQVKFKFAFLW